jgi:hypothetical protein
VERLLQHVLQVLYSTRQAFDLVQCRRDAPVTVVAQLLQLIGEPAGLGARVGRDVSPGPPRDALGL